MYLLLYSPSLSYSLNHWQESFLNLNYLYSTLLSISFSDESGSPKIESICLNFLPSIIFKHVNCVLYRKSGRCLNIAVLISLTSASICSIVTYSITLIGEHEFTSKHNSSATSTICANTLSLCINTCGTHLHHCRLHVEFGCTGGLHPPIYISCVYGASISGSSILRYSFTVSSSSYLRYLCFCSML